MHTEFAVKISQESLLVAKSAKKHHKAALEFPRQETL